MAKTHDYSFIYLKWLAEDFTHTAQTLGDLNELEGKAFDALIKKLELLHSKMEDRLTRELFELTDEDIEEGIKYSNL